MSLGAASLGREEEQETVRPGDILAGKYRIERVLGSGGMGVVVAATHLKLDERVAIKFLLPDALASAEVVARFDREARAAVKIKSEHVARVIDVGTLDGGAPYIVMEHLEGSDLAGVVKKLGKLPVEQAVEYMLQAAEALAEAHAIGIVHRDLKPHNLFLTRRADGTASIKVLDFGISKVMPGASGSSEAEGSLTTTNAVLGSPIYMSPEQMSSPKSVDARADVWSFGATLYKLVTGKAPFMGDSVPQICGMILMGEEPPPLLSLRPDAPPGLEPVVRRCLQRYPNDRYANIADLAFALAEFGPPSARLSAERARRVLEAAGVPMSVPVPPPPTSMPPGSTSQPSFAGPGSQPSPVSGISLSSSGGFTGGAVQGMSPGSTSQPSFGGTSQPLFATSQPSFPGTMPSAGAMGEGNMPRTMGSWVNTQGGAPASSRSRSVLVAGGVACVLVIGVLLGAFVGRGDGSASVGQAASSASVVPDAVQAPPRPSATEGAAAASEPPIVPSGAPSSGAKAMEPAGAKPQQGQAAPVTPTAPVRGAPVPRPKPAGSPKPDPKKKGGGDLFDERI